jgi:phosphohistidine phosphatase SixA
MKRFAAPAVTMLLAVTVAAARAEPEQTPSCAMPPGKMAAAAAASDSSAGRPSAAGDSARGGTAATSMSGPSRVASRYHAPDSTLIAALKHGGYILVFRHGKTDWGQRDAEVLDFADRAAQRNLSEAGRKEAAEIGTTIAALHIPIGAVRSSPMWRCRDTATLAFGRADTTIRLFQKGRESREARLQMLSTPPPSGTNTVLVTHQDVLLPIMRLKREELGEGEALIVRPHGAGNFEVLAQASLADWIRFLPSRKP